MFINFINLILEFKNMDKQLKVGIIGCGKIAKKHIKFLEENPNTKVIAVCDNKEERAKNASIATGNVPYYLNYNEMLQKEDMDIVHICSPSGLHPSMSIDCLKSGFHVLCEKPMALNLRDADKMIEAERESGKKLFIVKQNRFNPPIMVLKDVIYKRFIGDVHTIISQVLWNRRQDYYDEEPWRGTLSLDGGALYTQSCHFLDLMIWIGGRVKSVYAKMNNFTHPNIETEDTGTLILTFESGAKGILNYTTSVFEKNCEGSITVLGTKGTIKVGGEYLNELEHWHVEGYPCPKLPESAPANDYGSYKGSMSNHDKVIQNVVDVLFNNATITTSSLQGRKSIEVMQAAHISARTNKEIFLPLGGEEYNFSFESKK
jgi:predicted dehydrogenase